jgi:hypothetical protein
MLSTFRHAPRIDNHPANIIVPAGAGTYHPGNPIAPHVRSSLDIQYASDTAFDSPITTGRGEDAKSAMSDKFADVQHLETAGVPEKEQMVTVIAEMSNDVNPLMRGRTAMKEYLGEFLGTFVMITFGNGVNW